MSAGLRLAVLLALVAAAGFGATRLLGDRGTQPLPVLFELPDFRLTEASGRQVSRADLAGAPWVADLIFTSCRSLCPALSAEMARLQSQTGDLPGVHLVSISVDPERDSPAVLADYATRLGADRSRWLFLTGEKAALRKLAVDGFKLGVAEGTPALGDDEILHSPRFVLIDGGSRVRGTYDARDAEAMLKLRGDLRRLVEEAGAG